MRILTLNTWQKSGPWKERWKLILQGLGQYSPDVAGFQELYDMQWVESVSQKAAYPFMTSPDSSQSGLVLTSRLPILVSELYTMICQSPFEAYKRYILHAEIAWNGKTISFFNTHLSWKIEDQATRQLQVRELWQWVKSRRRSGETVLMGDMNATPESDEITWLVHNSGLTDLFAFLCPGDPGFSWDNRNDFAGNHNPPVPNRRIDYIFAGEKYLKNRLTGCKLVFTAPDDRGLYASDHFGVLGEVRD